jgi:hypothetical protein
MAVENLRQRAALLQSLTSCPEEKGFGGRTERQLRLHSGIHGHPDQPDSGVPTNLLCSSGMMRQRILWGSGAGSVRAAIAEIRQYAMEQLKDIRAVLREQAPSARLTLSRHVNQIVMGPTT